MPVSFADFLTPGGVTIAAGIVTGFVEVVKATIPKIDEAVSGALLAFGLTAGLYVLTAVATGVPTLDAGLNVFLAWLACATAAIGIKSAVSHVVTVAKGGDDSEVPAGGDDVPDA